MDLHPDFSDLLAAFEAADARYALLGGYAVAYYGKPRATKDLDLLVSGRDGNPEKVAQALQKFGAPASVVAAARVQSDTEVVFLGVPPCVCDGVSPAHFAQSAGDVRVGAAPQSRSSRHVEAEEYRSRASAAATPTPATSQRDCPQRPQRTGAMRTTHGNVTAATRGSRLGGGGVEGRSGVDPCARIDRRRIDRRVRGPRVHTHRAAHSIDRRVAHDRTRLARAVARSIAADAIHAEPRAALARVGARAGTCLTRRWHRGPGRTRKCARHRPSPCPRSRWRNRPPR